VFRFDLYAAGVAAWSGSRNTTRLQHLLLGCCDKVEVTGMCVVRVLLSVMQLSVDIFVLG
jgi:hypothetical protein